MTPARLRSRGQAATEYLVLATALAAALFAPLLDGASPAQRLVDAIATAYRSFAVIVALQ